MTPQRRKEDHLSWYARQRILAAFLLLTLSATIGLAVLTVHYHSLVRKSENDLYSATLGSCMRQNQARAAANDSTQAISQFLRVAIHVSVVRARTQHGDARRATTEAIALYRNLLDHQHVVPIVDCRRVIPRP